MDTKKLRQKILDLAIHGKLVPQAPNDEPASILLERIKTEKERLIKEGKIKRNKKYTSSDTPHYENVPFEIPEGWVWCKFQDCMDVRDGTHDSPQYTQEGYPLITSKDFKNGLFDFSKTRYISEVDYKNIIKRSKVDIGDILYSMIGGNIGSMIYIQHDNYFDMAIKNVALFKPYQNSDISTKYIFNFLESKIKEYQAIAIGGAQPFVGLDIFRNTLVPLPPLAEQHRIVTEIEKWFALIDIIENGKADLQTTIKQTKSKILDLAIHGKLVPQDPNDEPAIELLKRINPDFTPCDNVHYTFKIPNSWTWCKLGDIAQSNIGLTYKPTDITGNGIPVYRSNNIRDRKIDKSDLVRVNAPILEKQFLNIGDLLICARNGSRRLVGKCAIIEELDEATSFGAFMAVCRSEYNQWIFNLLNTTYFDRYLDDSNSTAINQVTQRMLLALHIPLPPLSEQQRIVQKIEELFSVLDNIQNALEV